eukprot:UN04323
MKKIHAFGMLLKTFGEFHLKYGEENLTTAKNTFKFFQDHVETLKHDVKAIIAEDRREREERTSVFQWDKSPDKQSLIEFESENKKTKK